MNKLESTIYNLVRKNPALKQFVRNMYQGIFDLLPRKKEYFASPYQYWEGFFFGFHDVTPFSFDETKLLANQNRLDLRMPLPTEGLDVGYFDLEQGTIKDFHRVDTSYAWNYHKGCRLQWLDKNRMIYNTAIANRLVSKIHDLVTGEYQVIDYPIDAVYQDEQRSLASSFSYERLERCMPGYGSHYVWNNRNQLIASCIINGNSCHVLYDMKDVDHYQIIVGDVLNSDGHQSFISDTSFVADTYPDKYRMAKIYKADINTQSADLLLSIYSPKEFQTKDFKCHIACDLHPRVSPSGKYLCFDSPRTGKRGLYIMPLSVPAM